MLTLNLLHDLRELMDLVRPEYEIDMRCPLDELVALLLRHTARDAKDQLRILTFQMLDLADLAVDLVLRRLPHAAGIQQDKIGSIHLLRPLITDCPQLPFHTLGITDIHLTAIDANKCFFLHIHTR